MIIFFTEQDMVSFGEYMVSKERKQLYEEHMIETIGSLDLDALDEKLKHVHDSDLGNWNYIVNKIKKENESKYN